MSDPTVTAPVSTKHYPSIYIALGRTFPLNAPDCDYVYGSEQSWAGQAQSVPLMVPFAGTWPTQQPLANLNGVNFTSGVSVFTQIYPINSSGIGPASSSTPPDISKVTGDAATGIVTWDYHYVATDVPPTPNSLIYETIPDSLSQGGTALVLSAFYCQIQVPTVGDPGIAQLTVCSTDWPEGHSPTCYLIPPLSFWWHCLAVGSQVTLADGSRRPIEEVDNRCRVRTGYHREGSLGVEATTRGLHHRVRPGDPVSGIYRLTSAGGRVLVLTGGHPVVTRDGLVRASDLQVGMSLLSEDGPDEVMSLEPAEADVQFANLKLIDADDRARGLASTVGTFFANGLLVGDHAAMEQVHYNNTHSLDYMKARLPEHYHVDYASTLAAIARDNRTYGTRY